MFWDNVAPLYDFFERFCNGKVYRETSEAVAKEITASDEVLECACGTGAITVAIIAPLCKKLIATDVSYHIVKGNMSCMIAVIRK